MQLLSIPRPLTLGIGRWRLKPIKTAWHRSRLYGERFPDAPEYIYASRLIRILVVDLWWAQFQSRLSSDGLTAQWRAAGRLGWTHHIDSDPYGCVERLHSTVDALRHPPTWYRNELHDMLDYDLDALIGLRSSVHRLPASEGRRVRARLNCL